MIVYCLIWMIRFTLLALELTAECGKNIQDYMVETLGIDRNKIDELGNLLYKNYGTTLAGLRAIGYDFDYDDYHCFIHGRLPYENLKPDPVLRSLLLSLPIRKVIFTNADKAHAAKALNKLGLEDCFEGIICFETLNPTNEDSVLDDEDVIEFAESTLDFATSFEINNGSSKIFDIAGHFSQPDRHSILQKTRVNCKPSGSAIERAIEIDNTNPPRTMFFDNSVRNIQAGKRVGLYTVLVGKSQRVKGADYALENMHNIREAIPELWETDIQSEVSYSSKVAVETSIRA